MTSRVRSQALIVSAVPVCVCGGGVVVFLSFSHWQGGEWASLTHKQIGWLCGGHHSFTPCICCIYFVDYCWRHGASPGCGLLRGHTVPCVTGDHCCLLSDTLHRVSYVNSYDGGKALWNSIVHFANWLPSVSVHITITLPIQYDFKCKTTWVATLPLLLSLQYYANSVSVAEAPGVSVFCCWLRVCLITLPLPTHSGATISPFLTNIHRPCSSQLDNCTLQQFTCFGRCGHIWICVSCSPCELVILVCHDPHTGYKHLRQCTGNVWGKKHWLLQQMLGLFLIITALVTLITLWSS